MLPTMTDAELQAKKKKEHEAGLEKQAEMSAERKKKARKEAEKIEKEQMLAANWGFKWPLIDPGRKRARGAPTLGYKWLQRVERHIKGTAAAAKIVTIDGKNKLVHSSNVHHPPAQMPAVFNSTCGGRNRSNNTRLPPPPR
eukprot:COSAG02_NODE_30152_length_556_cov_1.006565_2_plen_140_part_01